MKTEKGLKPAVFSTTEALKEAPPTSPKGGRTEDWHSHLVDQTLDPKPPEEGNEPVRRHGTGPAKRTSG